MKRMLLLAFAIMTIASCQQATPKPVEYVPVESIQHYYIEKQEGPDYRINFVHVDLNCKENLYYCPEIFVEKKTHWALCPKCIHPETAKEILEP